MSNGFVKWLAGPALSLAAAAASAETPAVIVDVAPAHALVARVMEGVGEPELLLPPETSPHGFSLRPSQARGLQEAGLIVTVGAGLTPWLDAPLDALAADAQRLVLAEAEGVDLLPFREVAVFAVGPGESHDHGHDHDDDHAHDDHGHDEHAHDEHGHDEQAHDHGHGGHDHGPIDAHLWLDPDNARAILAAVAEALAALDAENADRYRANAVAAAGEIDALEAEIRAMVPETPPVFVVEHDAYQYFETHFGLQAAGAVRLSDDSAPSAGQLAALRDAVADSEGEGRVCLIAEPQSQPAAFEVLADAAQVEVAVADAIGAGIEPGTGHYRETMLRLARAVTRCE